MDSCHHDNGQCKCIHRDDGSIMIKNPTGPKMGQIGKGLFKEEGLKITVYSQTANFDRVGMLII